jgi:hypothetical protein
VLAGEYRHELIADEPRIVFVSFHNFASDQLASDDLKQVRPDARFAEQVCDGPRGSESTIQREERLPQ